MHFFSLFFLPLTLAIQTIYLGVDVSSGEDGTYIAWFSDSNPCTQGTQLGDLSTGFKNCNQEFTLIDHTGITFTGCGHFQGWPASLPTGISDDGVPALQCVASLNPPTATNYTDGFFAACDETNAGTLNVIQYCRGFP